MSDRTQYRAEYNALNKAKIRAQRQRHYLENRDEMLRRSKVFQTQNPELIKAKNRAYYLANRERLSVYRKEYCRKNRDQAREKQKRLLETNENARLKHYLSNRIRAVLRGAAATKASHSGVLLGCSAEFFRGYIEARFQKGMTWENYGKWHLDHRIPCAEFDLRDPSQQRACFNYSNLQPLWAFDNLSKGSKRPSSHQGELI